MNRAPITVVAPRIVESHLAAVAAGTAAAWAVADAAHREAIGILVRGGVIEVADEGVIEFVRSPDDTRCVETEFRARATSLAEFEAIRRGELEVPHA